MPNSAATLETLRRPRLLVRAARHGLTDYSRARDLRRITGASFAGRSQHITAQLMHMEDNMEQRRLAGDHTYEPARHIELLVALMAESQQPQPRGLETKSRPMPQGWRVLSGEPNRPHALT